MLKALPGNQWTFSTAAHLLNRAGFGGPPAEIEKMLSLGPEAAVAHFVDYEKTPRGSAAQRRRTPQKTSRNPACRQAAHNRVTRLVARTHGQGPPALAGKNGAFLARPFRDQRRQSSRGLPDVASERVIPPLG